MTAQDITPADDVTVLMSHVGQTTPHNAATGVWRHQKKDGSVIDVRRAINAPGWRVLREREG